MKLAPPLVAAALPVARLLTPLPAIHPTSASDLLALQPPPARNRTDGEWAGPTGEIAALSEHLLRPNAAGQIDLVGTLNAAQNQSDQIRPANPFRVRYHSPLPGRSLSIAIEAVMLGAAAEQDFCVLNRQPLHRSEMFEGLLVTQISSTEIVLQRGVYRIVLPVGERAFTLQLPAE